MTIFILLFVKTIYFSNMQFIIIFFFYTLIYYNKKFIEIIFNKSNITQSEFLSLYGFRRVSIILILTAKKFTLYLINWVSESLLNDYLQT